MATSKSFCFKFFLFLCIQILQSSSRYCSLTLVTISFQFGMGFLSTFSLSSWRYFHYVKVSPLNLYFSTLTFWASLILSHSKWFSIPSIHSINNSRSIFPLNRGITSRAFPPNSLMAFWKGSLVNEGCGVGIMSSSLLGILQG